ncbi:Hypothetical predicted protein [Mytilus galloprovincialis]|nr:Hypothetical predicted protein [Mytilus galloprovincialis]
MQVVEVDMYREVTEAVESAVTDVMEDMQDHDTAVPHFFAERINKLKKNRGKIVSGPDHTKPGPSNTSPKPGPSHIYIDDSMDFSDTDDEDIPEVELCCVCKQFTPNQIRLGVGVELTKWVQCDNYRCKHWTHLKYCTELRAVRRNTKFYCMHCKDME